jgi:hypothetical protein
MSRLRFLSTPQMGLVHRKKKTELMFMALFQSTLYCAPQSRHPRRSISVACACSLSHTDGISCSSEL